MIAAHDLMALVGKALYGEHFNAPLAYALNVNKRTLRHWTHGRSRVPPNVWIEVVKLLNDRKADIERVLGLFNQVIVVPSDLPSEVIGK